MQTTADVAIELESKGAYAFLKAPPDNDDAEIEDAPAEGPASTAFLIRERARA